MSWIERAPLAWVGLSFFVALVLAYQAARIAGWRAAHKDDRGAYLVSSALVLLGLLMAFTFSAAQDRFRLRQELAVSEANAIGTSYLRVQLLDPPWRARLGAELLSYAETRARFAAEPPGGIQVTNETARLQAAIWRDMADALRSNSAPALQYALVNAMNEMFDLAAAERAARETRVPVAVMRVLVLCSITVAAVVGYAEAAGRRWNLVAIGLLALLTLSFTLILDLDRPASGRVRVNRQPLAWALDDIRAQERAAPALPQPKPGARP